jgi:hypothetical protein
MRGLLFRSEHRRVGSSLGWNQPPALPDQLRILAAFDPDPQLITDSSGREQPPPDDAKQPEAQLSRRRCFVERNPAGTNEEPAVGS